VPVPETRPSAHSVTAPFPGQGGFVLRFMTRPRLASALLLFVACIGSGPATAGAQTPARLPFLRTIAAVREAQPGTAGAADCNRATYERLEAAFRFQQSLRAEYPDDPALERRWRQAADSWTRYGMRCFAALVPAEARIHGEEGDQDHEHPGEGSGRSGLARPAGLSQQLQKIDDGGLYWTPQGPSLLPPGGQPGPGQTRVDGQSAPDFVTGGLKWGANSPFTGGTNVEGPGIAGGTVTFSFMANNVDITTESAGAGLNVAITSLPTYASCFDTEIRGAFSAWSAVANIDFVEVADNGLAFNAAGAIGDIRIGAHTFDGPLSVLAHAYFPPPNGVSAAGDLHFDRQENWTCNTSGIDIGLVTLHEVGHSIGLNHEATETAVMNAFYNPALTVLQPDDAEGAETIYDPVFVINEVDYDQVGTDNEEFIELKNISTHAININGWQLRLFNGSGETVYQTITLPNVSVASGDYFVICANPSLMCECDLDVSPDVDLIQNGAPDAMALFNPDGNFIDALSYEGSVINTDYIEGVGNANADSNTTAFIGYSRAPDGNDNNANSTDFALRCISPGAANLGTSSGCVDPCAATATPTAT